MAITVRPSSTAASERSRCRAARGSISEVASSSTRVCGSASTSRASASCWAWAGDSGRAAGADLGVQPVGQRVDPVQRVHRRRAPRAPRRRSASGRASSQVVAQGAQEDVVLLGDQRDVAAQLVQRQLDQRDAADRDRAGARAVDAGEQAAQRRLARAGRADHGQPLPRRDGQVDAVQHVAALPVGVADVVGRQPLAARAAPAPGVRSSGTLGDAEQPGQRGAARPAARPARTAAGRAGR